MSSIFNDNSGKEIIIWDADIDGDIQFTGEDYSFYIPYMNLEYVISILKEQQKIIEESDD